MEYAEGDKVAVYTANDVGGRSVRVRTIARITASQIVLKDDTRYRRKDLREVGGSSSDYGPRRELRPLDDPQVRQVRARQALSYLARSVADEVGLLASTATLGEVLDALELVEQQTATVRAMVEKLAIKEG